MVTSAHTNRGRVTPWTLTGAAVTLTGVLLLVLGTGPIRASASTLGGTATIVDETTPGGSASTDLFTLSVPTGAACTGSSSANPATYEYSYLIPQGAIPQASFATTLTFNGLGEPSQGLGLPESPSGDLFEAVSTAPPTTSGGPGPIANVPADFQWSQLISQDDITLTGSDGLLYTDNTSGIWETGIACASGSPAASITDYWNTEVTFTASSSDPTGFTWAAVPGLGAWGSTTTTTTTTVAPTTSTTVSPTTSTTASTTGTTAPTTVGTTATTTGSTGGGSSSASSGLESVSRVQSLNPAVAVPASTAGASGSGGSRPSTGGSGGSRPSTGGSGGASPSTGAQAGSGASQAGSGAGSSGHSRLATGPLASSGSPVHVYLAMVVVLLGLCMLVLGLLAKSGSDQSLEVGNP